MTNTPVNDSPQIAVAEVKALLRRFALERQQAPRQTAALELGELILCLMQQADRLGIDLVSAGEAQLQRAVTNARAGAGAPQRPALALVPSCALAGAPASATPSAAPRERR